MDVLRKVINSEEQLKLMKDRYPCVKLLVDLFDLICCEEQLENSDNDVDSRDKGIDVERVKRAVYNRIDFDFSDYYWDEFSEAFGRYWNNLQVGQSFDLDDVCHFISMYFRKKNLLLAEERIAVVLEIVMDYLTMTMECKPY